MPRVMMQRGLVAAAAVPTLPAVRLKAWTVRGPPDAPTGLQSGCTELCRNNSSMLYWNMTHNSNKYQDVGCRWRLFAQECGRHLQPCQPAVNPVLYRTAVGMQVKKVQMHDSSHQGITGIRVGLAHSIGLKCDRSSGQAQVFKKFVSTPTPCTGRRPD
jgi:hypothetical protein